MKSQIITLYFNYSTIYFDDYIIHKVGIDLQNLLCRLGIPNINNITYNTIIFVGLYSILFSIIIIITMIFHQSQNVDVNSTSNRRRIFQLFFNVFSTPNKPLKYRRRIDVKVTSKFRLTSKYS